MQKRVLTPTPPWEKEFEKTFFKPKSSLVEINGRRIWGPLNKSMFTPGRVKSFIRRQRKEAFQQGRDIGMKAGEVLREDGGDKITLLRA